MEYFLLLFLKIAPLYLGILMGYLAGKWLDVDRETLARVLFFLITPVIVFNGVIHTKLDMEILVLPLVAFGVSTVFCLVFYLISKQIWKDATKNLMAFSAGSANAGYFGLPIALLLFDEQGEGIYIMALLGLTLYENSVGYYMLAKGSHTASECVQKLITLPSLYALLIGLILNFAKITPPPLFVEFAGYTKGTYTILGMMVIGLGLSSIQHLRLDYKFIGMTFLAKFVAWPSIVLLITWTDLHIFGFFDQDIYDALILLSIVPLAANMVVLATLFKNHPEKAATAVLLSTLFAMIYVPLMAGFLLI